MSRWRREKLVAVKMMESVVEAKRAKRCYRDVIEINEMVQEK
jgi:hypothetical protein